MAQAVAVIRLGRKNVLVQQLQAVETLARVTVLATDKTGTLTTGEVTLAEVELLDGEGLERSLATEALAALAAADNHPNATMMAIAAAFARPPGWTARGAIPFDSSRKYSAVDFGAEGTWFVGAPEMLLPDDHPSRARVSGLASEGLRVLLLARGGSLPPAGALPDDLAPAALVTFSDDVRSDAAETIGYFLRENVVPKVISGDNPATVSAIARRCQVPHADRAVDARELPTDPDELAVGGGGERRVRPGHTGDQTGPAARAPGPGRGRRHDRGRCQRHVGAEGRRPRDRHGFRDTRREVGVGSGPARRPVLDAAQRGGRGPPGDRQHRTRGPALRHQELLGGRARRPHRAVHDQLSDPATAALGHRRAHDRDPRLRPVLPGQPRPRTSWVHPPRPAVLDPRGRGRRQSAR